LHRNFAHSQLGIGRAFSIQLLPGFSTNSLPSPRLLHLSETALKKGKDIQKKSMPRTGVKVPKSGVDLPPDLLPVDEIRTAMTAEVEKLRDEFVKELSLRVDLRAYHQLPVTLADGIVHQLEKLGRIRQRNPTFLEIHLTNIEWIKPTKQAIESSGLAVNPYLEMNVIVVPLPRITRERREVLTKKAVELANNCQQKIRQIYNKYHRKLTDRHDAGGVRTDDHHLATNILLALQKEYVEMTKEMAKTKGKELMEEQI